MVVSFRSHRLATTIVLAIALIVLALLIINLSHPQALQHLLAPSGHPWQKLAPNGHNWQKLAPHGPTWQKLAPKGPAWIKQG